MKISDYVKENMFGYEVTYRLYEPQNGSNNYLICLHGIGEKGPSDGSELNEVEAHGYPKLAKEGLDFPFNIVAVQTDVTGYYTERKCLVPYIKLKYKANKIIVTGLSMGGIGTYEMVLSDQLRLIDAIAPVCGKLPVTFAASYPEIDIWAFHGDKDTTVTLQSDKAFIDTYNKTHKKQAKLRVYEGVGHNAWDYAYNPTNKYDTPNLYQWLLERFTDN